MNFDDLEFASMTPGQTPETITAALESAGMDGIEVTVYSDEPVKTETPGEQPAGENNTTSSEQPEGGTTAAAPGSETGTAPETVQTTQEQEQPRKPSRLAKLRLQRDEAIKREQTKDREIEELRKQLAPPPAAAAESTPTPIVEAPKEAAEDDKPAEKPKVENFEQYEDFVEALADWKLEERDRKIRVAAATQQQTTAEQDAKAKTEAAQKAYNDRWAAHIEETKSRHADFDQVISNPEAQSSIAMNHAFRRLPHGGEVAYYLGQHPEESRRICQLTEFPVNPDGSFRATPDEVGDKLFLAFGELLKIQQSLNIQAAPAAESPDEGEEDFEEEIEPAPVAPAAQPVTAAATPKPVSQPQPTPIKVKPAPPNPVGNRGTSQRRTPLDMKPDEVRNVDPNDYRKFRQSQG